MIISENRVKELVLQAMENVRDSDPAYRDLILDDDTVILGVKSPMDSVAFTTFLTDLEGKLEDELRHVCDLKWEQIYDEESEVGTDLSVSDIAKWIVKTVELK